MSDLADPKDAVRDPVCGKPVDPLRARAVGIFNGVTRYFCSQDCKAKFGDPRKEPSVPNSGPNGAERRFVEPPSSSSGQWFAKPAERAPEVAPDRFEDLEGAAVPKHEPPTPSILLDVRNASASKTRMWVLIALAALVAIGIGAAVVHGQPLVP